MSIPARTVSPLPGNRRGRDANRDLFAERVAEHGDTTLAAREIDVSASYGRLLWSDIKRGLGWQAR